MWLVEYAYRLLTDKQVKCRDCGAPIGYVVRTGHVAWLCAPCGAGRVTPV